MSCADNRAVMFVVESSATKVDKPDVCPFHTPDVLSLEKKRHLLNISGHDTSTTVRFTRSKTGHSVQSAL